MIKTSFQPKVIHQQWHIDTWYMITYMWYFDLVGPTCNGMLGNTNRFVSKSPTRDKTITIHTNTWFILYDSKMYDLFMIYKPEENVGWLQFITNG